MGTFGFRNGTSCNHFPHGGTDHPHLGVSSPPHLAVRTLQKTEGGGPKKVSIPNQQHSITDAPHIYSCLQRLCITEVFFSAVASLFLCFSLYIELQEQEGIH